MKAVHFGAGNIGRGFIGSLLHHSGYTITFVDVNEAIVKALREKQGYEVVFIDETDSKEVISGVTAIHASEGEAVIDAIAQADLITTAVFVKTLGAIAPVIAKGLVARMKSNPRPVQVIACENAINASSVLQTEVYHHLTPTEQAAISEKAGFPNVAIDRQALNCGQGDITTAYVERFYEMVINESELTGQVKPLQAVSYVKKLYPYIERKLFMVNAAHAITAYVGYLYQYETIQQALQDPFIFTTVKQALQETSVLLQQKHGFHPAELEEYSKKIIHRFSNPLLTDQVTRVARSPLRKLGEQERLLAPAKELLARNLPVDHVLLGIAAALLYAEKSDEEAVRLQTYRRENGVEQTLIHYSHLVKGDPLLALIRDKVNDVMKLGGNRRPG